MLKPIKLPLTRDQARAVQETFCPYLEKLCELKIREAGKVETRIFNARAISNLFFEVEFKIRYHLTDGANTFNIDLSYAQALVLHDLLKEMPIEPNQVWHVTLRDGIIGQLHSQLSTP